jgi:uncharacterized protein YndB with AHSA1/START domain
MSASATQPEVQTAATGAYELKITRTFDAPRQLVWKAWTDPAMRREWVGPRGFSAGRLSLPGHAGGRWACSMEGWRPATQQRVSLGQSGTVMEMRPPELLVFTVAWDDRSAVGLPPTPYKENTVTIRLEEKGNKTVMHFTQGPFATESECQGHTGGWNSSFDKFAEFILAEQAGRTEDPDEIPSELHLKRVFNAPRDLVFKAWTEPAMLA